MQNISNHSCSVTWDGLHVFSGEGSVIQTFASFKGAFIFIWKLRQSLRSLYKLTKSPPDNSRAISFQYFVTYQLIIITCQLISSKKLILYPWLEKDVNIPIALFQFLCSGQILVKPKQAPPHGEQTIQSMELQRNRWSGKDLPALTSIHSWEAFTLPWRRFHFTLIYQLFSESSGSNLSLTCSSPSSLSTSPRFALCFWKCM